MADTVKILQMTEWLLPKLGMNYLLEPAVFLKINFRVNKLTVLSWVPLVLLVICGRKLAAANV